MRGGVDRRRAEKARLGDLDLLAVAIAIVIAGHAIARRAHPGHDRDIVRVGERRHLSLADRERTARREGLGQPWHEAPLQRIIDVVGVPTISADRQYRPLGRPIHATVGDERDGHNLTGEPLRLVLGAEPRA